MRRRLELKERFKEYRHSLARGAVEPDHGLKKHHLLTI